MIDAKTTTYMDNVIDWALLTKGQDATVELASTSEGIGQLFTEYNLAYEVFYNKVMELGKVEKTCLLRGYSAKFWLRIQGRAANEAFVNELEKSSNW